MPKSTEKPGLTPNATAQERMGAALAKLRAPAAPAFEVAPSSIVRRSFDVMNARARARRRALVKPQNAADLVAQLCDLKEGDRLHAVTPGHYVFADLLVQLADRLRPAVMYIATLSMSTDNVDALAARLDRGTVGRIRFVISNYFASTNREIYDHLVRAGEGRALDIAVVRTHAKIALLHPNGVIETSANLRSSQNIEQVTAMADQELHDFHRAWMAPLFGDAP